MEGKLGCVTSRSQNPCVFLNAIGDNCSFTLLLMPCLAQLESIATEDAGREGGLGFITSTAALNLTLPAEPATQLADGAMQVRG